MSRRQSHKRHRTAAAAPVSSEDLWQAVVARDKAFDGRFVYSVASTGVYCRPSCPARRAKRENVGFHASPAAAVAAGFRPCKRCRPDGPPLDAENAQLIADACRRIEDAEVAPALAELARGAGMSPFHFHRVFRSTTGVTPKDYADAHRHTAVRAHLPRSASVTEALHDSGFGSPGRFYAAAPGMLGMSPSAFRAGGQKAVIKFAAGTCWLGAILVAASEKGVCAILIGDEPEPLLRDLEDRFPKAVLIGGDAGFERLAAKAIAAVERPQKSHALPLDIQGTAFQHRVWKALRNSCRRHTELRRHRPAHRQTGSGAGGRASVRGQSCRRHHPVPSRRPQRRRALGLQMGDRAQAEAA